MKKISKEAKAVIKKKGWNVWAEETDIRGTYSLKGYDTGKLLDYARANNIPIWHTNKKRAKIYVVAS